MSSDVSTSEHILTEIRDRIFQITLNRPEKKNALTQAMYKALADALDAADADAEVRVILIAGNGDCFCSGNDVMDFLGGFEMEESSPVVRFLMGLASARKPVIAAVNGKAVGIGVTMLLHCDLVYAAPNARYRMPFVNLGLCPEAGSSYLLPRLAGYHNAAELLLLGREFDNTKAICYGIVNDEFQNCDFMEQVWRQATELAVLPPEAVRVSKALLKRTDHETLQECMMEEARQFMLRLSSPEAAEALQAFLQGRKPDFSQFA